MILSVILLSMLMVLLSNLYVIRHLICGNNWDWLLNLKELPDDIICNIAIYAYNTTLYSICDQASDLWQKLELASELESDL